MGSGGGSGVGGLLGGAAGFALGGPMGAAIGSQLGAGIGGALDPMRVNTSGFQPSAEERAFVKALQARSRGEGPSVAEQQMQRGLSQAQQQALAMSINQRGVSPGLAARLGQQAQAEMALQGTQNAGMLRAQEQMSADQLMAQVFASQRQSAAQAAQLQAQADAANRQQTMGLFGGLGNSMLAYSLLNNKQTPTAVAVNPMQGGGQAGQYGQTMMPVGGGMSHGGRVPGKAPVKGDHPANDTVPAMLSPGELVVPRTVVEDGPDAVYEFAKQILKKHGGKK